MEKRLHTQPEKCQPAVNPLSTLVERLLSDMEVTRGGGLQSHVFAPKSSTGSAAQTVTRGFLGPAGPVGVRQGEPGQGPRLALTSTRPRVRHHV